MESRKSALEHLRKEKRSGRDLELPVKKVSIMADSKEGLEKGLDTAEDILKNPKKVLPELPSGLMDAMSDETMDDGAEDSEDHEMHEMMSKDLDECSPEELKDMVMKMRMKLSND